MKTLILAAVAIVTLGGCVAVPYHAEPAGYYYSPPPAVHFQYNYHGGHRHHYHHRHYRHR